MALAAGLLSILACSALVNKFFGSRRLVKESEPTLDGLSEFLAEAGTTAHAELAELESVDEHFQSILRGTGIIEQLQQIASGEVRAEED